MQFLLPFAKLATSDVVMTKKQSVDPVNEPVRSRLEVVCRRVVFSPVFFSSRSLFFVSDFLSRPGFVDFLSVLFYVYPGF